MKDIEKLELLEAEIKSYNKIYDDYSEFDSSFRRRTYFTIENDKVTKISLRHLTALYEIKKLPTALRLFKNLKELNLENNNFSNYSYPILMNMKQLETLNLSNNKLWNIDFINELTNLKNLDVSYNDISYISYDLGNLVNLEYLSIDLHKLRENFDFPFLKKLKTLEISGKNIILKHELPNLKTLIIDTNNYNLLQIDKCKNLEELILESTIDNNSALFFKYLSDMKYLKKLTIDTNNYELFEIDKCVYLEELVLNSSINNDNILFLKKLSEMKYLKKLELNIDSCEKFDFSFLKKITTLQELELLILKSININFLESIPKNINLSLDLNFTHDTNDIKDFSVIKKLPNLIGLFGEINDSALIENSYNLEYLWLGPTFKDINILKNLTKLKNLSLEKKEITDISFLSDLKSLTELNLNDNSITDISALKDLTNLENLYLKGNKIKNITSLKNLKKLKNLILSDNKIINIHGLENLIELNYLFLDDNKINDISPIKNLKKLEYLTIENNNINDITVIENFENLEVLHADNNSIIEIPILNKSSKLERISLENNNISNLSPLKELKNKSKLNFLGLSDNNISNISDIKEFSNLELLNLDNNEIIDISPLENLKNLSKLWLRHNKIKDISVLTKLPNLFQVFLNDNNIKKIPNFNKQHNFVLLNLINNKITKLPLFTINFNMKFYWSDDNYNWGLSLKGNPMKEPSIETCKQGDEAIWEYFRNLEKE